MSKWVVRQLSWIVNESSMLIDFEFCGMPKWCAKKKVIIAMGWVKCGLFLVCYKVYRRNFFCRGGQNGVFLGRQKFHIKNLFQCRLLLTSTFRLNGINHLQKNAPNTSTFLHTGLNCV
jgi:hypothetical protein